MIDFSFVLATRGRPDMLTDFITSARDMAAEPSRIEFVLAIDDDDIPTQEVDVPGVIIKKIVLPPLKKEVGKAKDIVGLVNNLYKHTEGRFIFGANDDIVVRTENWDKKMLSHANKFEDDICLLHINDLIFGPRLCCFPCLSRKTCEILGHFIPEKYKFYRVDDHIFELFLYLASLGERRLIYLDDVVFEHLHYDVTTNKKIRFYTPDPVQFHYDNAVHIEYNPERKRSALKLYEYIQNYKRIGDTIRCEERLKHFATHYDIRLHPHYLKMPHVELPDPVLYNLTVIVVSNDLKTHYAQKCIESIKRNTTNYHLHIIENHSPYGMDAPPLLQSTVSSLSTRFVAIVADDVIVPPGWADDIIRYFDGNTAIIMPRQKNLQGQVISTGVFPDEDTNSVEYAQSDVVHDQPQPIPCPDGGCFIMDLKTAKTLRFQTLYRGFLFDIDLGLQAWESGFKVLSASFVEVLRLNPTQDIPVEIFENILKHDLYVMNMEWVLNKRLTTIREQKWSKYPEINDVYKAIYDTEFLIIPKDNDIDEESYQERFSVAIENIKKCPNFYKKFLEYLNAFNQAGFRDGLPLFIRHFLQNFWESLFSPVLLEVEIMRHNVFLHQGRFVAIPSVDGMLDEQMFDNGCYIVANSFGKIKKLLASNK